MTLEAMSQVIEEAKASEFVEGVLERDSNEVNSGSEFPIEETPRQERPGRWGGPARDLLPNTSVSVS